MPIDKTLVSEEYHENASLQNFNSVDDLAKSFIELKSMQGHSVRLPSENASEEDINSFNAKMSEKLPNWMLKPDFENPEQSSEFWSKLGTPSDPKEYKMPEIKVPDGMELNADRQEYFRNLAKEANMTQTQFNTMMSKVFEKEIESNTNAVTAKEQAIKDIKTEWGQAYDERLAIAAKTAEATGAPDSIVAAVKDGTAGVETMNWMYNTGKALGDEGRDIINNSSNSSGKDTGLLSPGEALRQLDEIHANPEHPYYTAIGDEKKRATDAYIKLMKMAHPNASTDSP